MRRPVLLDATRLLDRLGRVAPTGVDRVCLAYSEHLIAEAGERLTPVWMRGDRIGALDPAWFGGAMADLRARWTGRTDAPGERRLLQTLTAPPRGRSLHIQTVEGRSAASARRSAVVTRLLKGRPLPARLAGALYVNVGHTGLDRTGALERLTGEGVRPVIFIHDLIPITHPEYCRPGEAGRHAARLRAALRLGRGLIVNSAATAESLSAFAARLAAAVPPVRVAHLGLEPTFAEGPGWTPTDRPFFVHVGTLEGRKNLAFLLNLWRRWAETHGPAAPQLLLAGREGWEHEAVMALIQRSPPLQGLVHSAADLPDRVLAHLIASSHGLLAPSMAEGFDLPVAEALALGVPVIASDIPAHRELAPDATRIDPLDGPAWIAAIAAASERRLKPAPPRFRPWSAHFAEVADWLASGPEDR